MKCKPQLEIFKHGGAPTAHASVLALAVGPAIGRELECSAQVGKSQKGHGSKHLAETLASVSATK